MVYCISGAAGFAAEWGQVMSEQQERAFHLERAEQCRSMAAAASDPAIRHLHEQLAQFHEAEAKRQPAGLTANQDDLTTP